MLMPWEGKGNLFLAQKGIMFLPQIIFLPQKGIILPQEGILFPQQGIMFPQKGIMNLSQKRNMFPQKGKQLRRISNVKFAIKLFEIIGN